MQLLHDTHLEPADRPVPIRTVPDYHRALFARVPREAHIPERFAGEDENSVRGTCNSS